VSSDIDWVNELNEISKELGNEELLSTLKIDVFKNRIFVLTPM
jgi:(p)ppGpp synthase/HD superfamily hydrolase